MDHDHDHTHDDHDKEGGSDDDDKVSITSPVDCRSDCSPTIGLVVTLLREIRPDNDGNEVRIEHHEGDHHHQAHHHYQ